MNTAALDRPLAAPRRGRLDDLLLALAALALWQAVYWYVGDSAIASPLATAAFLSQFLRGAGFWSHFAATMTAFGAALAISAVLGVAAGLVLGARRFAGDVAEPLLTGLYAIPKITLYPVILLIFGLGISAKVAFGVIHGVIPIAIFTLGAVKNVSPVLVRAARAMRLSQADTIRSVLAPAILPELMTGLRVGFSLTLLGVLIGEMFASQRGLGFLIVNGTALHNVRLSTGMIVVVVGFALIANGLMRWLERRASPAR